jgi:hypothetical protein
MTPIGADDVTTTELETPTRVLPIESMGTDVAWPQRTRWYDRTPVLLAAGFLGIVGLIALAVSVVTVSDESTRAPRPATTMATPSTPTLQATDTATPGSLDRPSPSPTQPPGALVNADPGLIAETENPSQPSQLATDRYPHWWHRHPPRWLVGPSDGLP